MSKVQGVSPAKLILSGEHSVVYGKPALVMAVARFTRVSFTPISESRRLRLVFQDLLEGEFPLNALRGLKRRLDGRFQAFLEGRLPVSRILQRPDDLVLYTLAQLAFLLPAPGVARGELPCPGRLECVSDIPLGVGMGSSAAVIAATLVLYERLLRRSLSLEERFERVRFCERLQHGRGSAIDAAAVVYGGVQFLSGERPQALDLASARLQGFYWVLSGVPESSTGECVMAVRQRFAGDGALWQAFEDCTQAFYKALQGQDDALLRACFFENERLLERIGVVPVGCQGLLRALERSGAAVKVSGAGSVRGDFAGMLLVYQPDAEAMAAVMRDFPELDWGELVLSSSGAHVF